MIKKNSVDVMIKDIKKCTLMSLLSWKNILFVWKENGNLIKPWLESFTSLKMLIMRCNYDVKYKQRFKKSFPFLLKLYPIFLPWKRFFLELCNLCKVLKTFTSKFL